MTHQRSQEETYLKTVYAELTTAEEELSHLLKNATQEGLSTMKRMGEDVRLSHDNISDNLDTFAVLEMKNREIDQMNIRLRSAETELKKVTALLDSPYFGKVTIDFLDDEPSSDFYIGVQNFSNKDGDNRVYDWRSPVSELFYSGELGRSAYTANGQQIEVDIENRRQFIIEKDQLIKYFDTSIAIQDDILLEALERDSLSHMRDITATIQKEQNVIIRDVTSPVLLVNGVAGSGKTSTIMQRVAYLLYLLQKKITSDDLLILSPNHHFIDYVSDVLPALGERNPLNLTMLQFVQTHLGLQVEEEASYFARIIQQDVDPHTQVLRDRAFVAHVTQSDALLQSRLDFFKDIRLKGKVIISKDKVLSLFNTTPSQARLLDRIQATKQLLHSYWQERLLVQAKSRRIQDQILTMTEEQQQHHFGRLIADDSEKMLIQLGEQLLRKKYRAIQAAIEGNAWVSIRSMFESICQSFTPERLSPTLHDPVTLDEGVILLMIQQHFVEKSDVPKMSFLLIDEVQDYNYAQLSLLLDLFPGSEFTLVGDENQAIFNSTIAFSEIRELFETRGQRVKRYDLLSSYRSSGAITKVFRQLAANNEHMEIVPVRPDGNPPKVTELTEERSLLEVVTQFSQQLSGARLTVITKSDKVAEAVSSMLYELIQEGRVQVLPISLSKGLEFDHVLIYDVSEETYHTDRDQKILYTAISRAMQDLFLVYQGQKSRFIEQVDQN